MSKRSTLALAGLPATFWAALLLLVLNDHVLKGSGLLPSIVTGKLSDFAGLLVAPIVLCAAFSVRTDRARGLLIGLVALGFAAVKLIPMLADAAGATLTALGMPSRIWCDPTDLVAFVVLPWAALLAQRVHITPQRAARRLAVGIAALACVATSVDGPVESEVRGPFVINWTHGEINLSITQRWTACGDPDNELSEPIEETLALSPGYMKQLGWDAVVPDSGVEACGMADIRVSDQTARVSWNASVSEPLIRDVLSGHTSDASAPTGGGLNYADDWAFERGIAIIGSAETPAFRIGRLLSEEDAP